MTRSFGLASFRDALAERAASSHRRSGYPVLTKQGQRIMLKKADEVRSLYGDELAPSDWDVVADIALAAREDISFHRLDRDNLTASDQRRHDHLDKVADDAFDLAERLYKQHLVERSADLRGDGVASHELRDGEFFPGKVNPSPRGEQRDPGPMFIRTNDRKPAAVARGARFDEHDVVREHANRQSASDAAVVGQHGSFGQMVRAMTTTSGSAIVPTTWASDIIDRARNRSAVFQAGAQLIPMDSKQVQIGRLTGDPTAAFRAEGSTVAASDPTFDNVTLDAKTMSGLVVGSLEWFQDADNVEEIVSNAIAEAIAQQLDLVGLYGSITTGAGAINLPTPPNPRGVLGTLNAVAPSSVLGAAANGTIQTAVSYYNELLDLIYTIMSFNEEPNGLIYNSKLGRQYAGAYDTTGQPLRPPDAFSEVPSFMSNQVPSYTQGTMANRATDVFAGDFAQLLIGQRLGLTIQTLTERYAENGQIGIIAHWRGDVQCARPRAFAVYKALQGGV